MTITPTLVGFDYPPFLIPQENGTEFALWEEVVYTARDGDSWVIPEGFRTDFATIPAIVAWAVPKLGAYTMAAIVHDLLCVGLNEWHEALQAILKGEAAYAHSPWEKTSPGVHVSHMIGVRIKSTGKIVPRPTASSIDADHIFRRIALDHGTDPVTARLIWTGVRWGALFSSSRREGFFRPSNLLPFLGWSLVFAPVLAPATLLALAGRAVLRIARWVRRTR